MQIRCNNGIFNLLDIGEKHLDIIINAYLRGFISLLDSLLNPNII